jgi:hypothetical protein
VGVRGRRAAVWLAVAGGSLALAVLAGWHLAAVPWAERRLEAATGYRAVIGSLSLWSGGVRAREVTLFGAPPFASAPLARIAELEIRLGGPGHGRLQPSAVLARGVQITFLRTGRTDNVRGAGGRAAVPRRAAGGPPVALMLRDGRVDAFIRMGPGYSLVARGARLSLDRPAEGPLTAQLEGISVDMPGLITLSAPRIALTSRGGRRSLEGQGMRLVLPGGGTLLDKLALTGELTADTGSLSVRSQVAPTADPLPPLTAQVELRGGAAHAALEIRRLPLAALRPAVRELGIETGAARAGLKLVLEAQPDGKSQIWVQLDAEGLGLGHARLDRAFWGGLDVSVRGQVAIDAASGRIEVDRSELKLLGLPLVVSGWSQRQPRWHGEWKIETPTEQPAACAPLLDAQPAPIRRILAGLELQGQLGLEASLAFDVASWESLGLAVHIAPRCRVERETTALRALLRSLEGGGPALPAWRELPLGRHHPDFVPHDKMPRHLTAAFITAEDGRFFQHRGFDLEMIRRALAHDLEMGTMAKGASTITQQLAKNLFLGPERTLSRKLAELVLGWRLDETMKKEQQLELYLNIIELGPGIRGVKRAAEVYFGKPLAKLTPLESAHLAALTPNPLGFARRFREGRVDDGWLHRLYDLLGMMKRSGRLSAAELNSARQSRLTLRRI